MLDFKPRRISLIAAACTAVMLMLQPVNAQAVDIPPAGDVNGDSVFNLADIVTLQRWLCGDGSLVSWELGDLDGNGVLNGVDLTLMKRQLIYPSVPDTPPAEPIAPPIAVINAATPTQGDVKMLAVYVDFPDQTYDSAKMYSTERISNELFGNGEAPYPYESVTNWFARSSYGNFRLSGDVLRYTCSNSMASYQTEDGFEVLAMEVLKGLDSQLNYADYDANNDGVIDCLALTVPLDHADDATKEFWYGCTATWYYNEWFRVDNERVHNLIIMDVMPYATDMQYLKQTLIHEMGHSMGLPDYYKYNASDDWDGFHGDAGYTRMDDSIGDFTSFDKLMYGWLTTDEIQVWNDNGTQTFELADAAQKGSCLILPITSSADDYLSEYFLVEYITDAGNNQDIYSWFDRSGVRIFHVQAECYTDYWNRTDFKYENYSDFYMGDDKIRVMQLVNDGNGFYHAGDTITYGTKNFAAYDSTGYQTINTGYSIQILSIDNGTCQIVVSK